MLKVGLTGGIGSGKSTACIFFHELGVPIIDTDRIARQLVEPGQPILARLQHEFGPDILTPHGELDRRTVREQVFSDPERLARLEGILHPAIRIRVRESLACLQATYVIIAIPLLVEKGWQNEVDRVLVVDCDESLQVTRASRRDQRDPETIRRVMTHQASREQRLAAAHDILHNDGDAESLRQQVRRIHQRYQELSRHFS